MSMNIRFPGGKKVYAHYNGFAIESDQSVKEGGEGSAPEPFALFIASIGTCAGLYVLSFCQERGISTEGLSMTVDLKSNEKSHMVEEVVLDIRLPDGFPEKYRGAAARSAELCFVKRHLDHPPKITVRT